MKKPAALSIITAFVLAFVLAVAACQDGSTEKTDSGIKGIATLGPLSPISRQGEANEKPYAGAVIIIKNTSGTEITRTKTAEDGSFSFGLPEGIYKVEGANPDGTMLPYAAAFEVKVEKGTYTEITVSFDTGIR